MPLTESPFSCRLLDGLFYMSCVLVFPSYWFVDRLLSCVVSTSDERSHGSALRILCLVFGAPLFLLLFVLSVPLCVFGLLLWAPLHQVRRPYSYQRSVDSQDPPDRTITGDCSFIFVSANLCLLPDGLARFSNLSHTQRRVSTISKLLCASPTLENGEDSLPICSAEDVLPMMEMSHKKSAREDDLFEVSVDFPQNADFICLQEVFDGRASRILRRCLGGSFPYILYDVGPSGPHSCSFKFFNSGLFLASRHPLLHAKYYIYPNARGEDALASKGLLCVKVRLGTTEQKQSIVGYINCTHLHAPESDATIRCDQMSLLLQWVSDFQAENTQDGELVAFDVLCGDLNFDNCSSDDCLEQKHGLFSIYRDPCRDRAGRDRPGTIGTLLRQEFLYHEAVNSPARLKSTLQSDSERRLYVAAPLPQDDGDGQWTGRRIDYILHREADSLLPVVVEKFQFITRLAGLSDHVPVALHLSSSLPEITAL
ncbi:sphingomyelin phosphodiesterase 5-like [Bufo gargarizans]|uniref:sphingomyelin phosphodiesterase 5-like n=1 Tax=Bufo gargarizans TaxID=30331 RepID=UPI001CF136FA|nr:sphingomyelin phosphodiesterase 5-like [Bufo gargarizans]